MAIPEDEAGRIAALHACGILDTEPEPNWDALADLAAAICRTPVAYIKFIDERRAWFKAKRGFPPDLAEVPREITICNTTICQADLVVIPDCVADPRFADSPTVTGWPHIRFYCGMPLIDEQGYALGTLCVLDFAPRDDVPFEQREAIRLLAQQAVALLELQRATARVAAAETDAQAARRRADEEQRRADDLLADILPRGLVDEYKLGGCVQPRYFPLATVVFADLARFTDLAASLQPAVLVRTLDRCFGAFDDIVEAHGIEKIKTIGDCYMAAGGVPRPNRGQVVDGCLVALGMQARLARLNREQAGAGLPALAMRIGLHVGPVMAGVVGRRKFTFDIWGDAVNLAQRMEAAGEPGRINVSEDVHDRVRHLFQWTPRGRVEVAGKGRLPMYFLDRIKPELSADAAGVEPNALFNVERGRG